MVDSDEEVGSSLQGDNIHLIDGDNGVGEIKSRSLDELRKIKTKWRDDLKVLRDSKAQWLAKGKGIMSSPGVCDNSTVGQDVIIDAYKLEGCVGLWLLNIVTYLVIVQIYNMLVCEGSDVSYGVYSRAVLLQGHQKSDQISWAICNQKI